MSTRSERSEPSLGGAHAVLPFKQWLRLYAKNNWALHADGASLDSEDCALLKRWLADDRANEAWDVIRAHAEQHDGPIGEDAAIHFIVLVLGAKQSAEQENQLARDVAAKRAERKKGLRGLRKRIAQKIKTAPEDQLARWAKWTADTLSPLAPIATSPPRVRSNRRGSRAKTLFIRDVSAAVQDTTGKYLDEQVAIIAQIAFDDRDVDADTVRKARRPRS
jgi:hypothetical protein